MKTIYFVLLSILAVSCAEEKSPEIFLLNIGGVYKSNETGKLSMYEYFVITNPPKDTVKLFELISAFNTSTLSVDSIIKYKSGLYYRAFYEETKKLSRDYKEVSGWGSDRIEDHANDQLLSIRWNDSRCKTKTRVWYSSAVYNFSIQADSVPDEELFWFWKREKWWGGKRFYQRAN